MSSIPDRDRGYSLSQLVQTGLLTHSTSLSADTEGSLSLSGGTEEYQLPADHVSGDDIRDGCVFSLPVTCRQEGQHAHTSTHENTCPTSCQGMAHTSKRSDYCVRTPHILNYPAS